MVTPECAPVAKVGGLADVVYGLSREVEVRGNDVEIILPKYDCMRYDKIWDLTITLQDLWVPWYDSAIHCTVWFGFVDGRKCFFIEPHSADNFFNRHMVYGCNDDPMRFAFFSKAALEFLLKSNKRPDIVHCHDWQTGLVPVLLAEMYKPTGLWNQRVCFTIHNFKHQGRIGAELLYATGLNRPEFFFHQDRMQDNHNRGALNVTKAGIVYSNFTTTVSPQHAYEAQHNGFGLEQTLAVHQRKFGGVLNGIDYDVWNPEIDIHIPTRYTKDCIDEKYRNKEALRDRLWLHKEYKPIIAYIGRLDDQKGLNLVIHTLFYALHHNAQCVVLGSPSNGAIAQHFWNIKNTLNDSPDCHIELGFDEELSHLIYAGADMLIVPSNFEPCGLTQMIALKYGTVPIVRAVGGLVNTVFDKDYSHLPWESRNGFVFHQGDNRAIESALERTIGLWYSYPDDFRQLMIHGMQYDYSWNYPGQDYCNIYEYIRHK